MDTPSPTGPVRLFLLCADEGDFLLLRARVAEAEPGWFDLEWLADPHEALAALASGQYHAGLIDHHLGPVDGLEVLRAAVGRGCQVPLILLMEPDESAERAALQAGAADALVKGQLTPALLRRSIGCALERRRAEQLAEADRHKDEFLAMLGHELRAPLAPVRNAISVLRLRPDDPAAVAWAADLADRQVQHLGRLVEDLLDVSRVARGKVRLRRQRLDLVRLVREAAEDQRPAVATAGLALDVELPAGPLWVRGDGTRLAQVVGNLLANAVKFTDPGGRVTVRVEAEGADVAVTVRDTGAGIEPERLPRLFAPFAQADRTLDRSQEGLGLGLALVKGLVQAHGGTVTGTSAGPGRGSAFTFRLPLDAPAAPALRAARPLRLLLIEDNRVTAESLTMLLALLGHDVTVAPGGPAGEAAAHRLRPDVVLIDLSLPDLDGWASARALRADPALARTRLIALSDQATAADRRLCLEAGFAELLVKPVAVPDLLRVLGVEGPVTPLTSEEEGDWGGRTIDHARRRDHVFD